ncbi:MAG: protein-L-isoaspartate O-methyltransferase [Caulobacteraceae bacterium]|nr:protein-L-isoaspartate O-methyltransferase [Caulobacter sp.]
MHQDYQRSRLNMVETQVRVNDVTDHAVQDAMRAVARERLSPPGRQHLAYAEAAIEYAPGWWMAEPRNISKLLQAVRPRPGERALAVAAPYAALVMAEIGCQVTARQPKGAPFAAVEAVLREAGCALEEGDIVDLGDQGPFDIVICEGALVRAPQAWGEALAVEGRLGVFEREGPVGKGRMYLQAADGPLARRELFDATPAWMPGFAPQPAFSL